MFCFVLDFRKEERVLMKFVGFLGFLLFLFPCVAFGASGSEFQNASRLLSAARRGDTQTVQMLINSGTDINYVDASGLSLVCTAVMNNDTLAIQVLQMYGADSSQCDRQIKKYKQKTNVAKRGEEYNFFSGLSSTHVLALSAVGVAAVVGGVALLAKAFDSDNKNGGSGSNGDRPNNNNGSGSTTTDAKKLFTKDLPYGPACSGTTCTPDFTVWEDSPDFAFMSTNEQDNYLLMSRAYNAMARGYMGLRTIRSSSDLSPVNLKTLYPYSESSLPGGGKPINVAMIISNGINAAEGTSAVDDTISWVVSSKISSIQSACTKGEAACIEEWKGAIGVSHKYYNLTTEYGEDENGDTTSTVVENTKFDLSGSGSVFSSATDPDTNSDTKLAKIIAGWEAGGRADADFIGFVPNGQLTAYRIGSGETDVSDYKNYSAILDALNLKVSGENVVDVIANLSLPALSSSLGYATVNDAAILNNEVYTAEAKKNNFLDMIDIYYNLNTNDDVDSYVLPSGIPASGKPSDNAKDAFVHLSNKRDHILINSAGRNIFNQTSNKVSPEVATFENFAPVVYEDLQNLFMTVVAVTSENGTQDVDIEDYSAANVGKLKLSIWPDANDASILYTSRMCGLTGTGNGGAMNPWCFAAPGTTDLEATAAMAGAVASVKSAFDYMKPEEIFLLLALTADGPYLGTDPSSGSKWNSTADLISYLQGMYSLPANLNPSQYLESFKQAFGYGMINLERATRPGTNVYFYSSNTNSIVSSSGVAYWRSAISNSSISHGSTVFSLANVKSIKTSFYDIIESADGSISLPRVWNASVSLNEDYKHGLYMGDVLADFNVDSANKRHKEIGNMTFDMSLSQRAYNDNMNGLDNLRVAFNSEKYDIDAEYQHYLTDGESRFNGRANGLLSLVSNTVSSGAKYKYGKFAVGMRAFSGNVSDENLLEKDPVVSSQFEPARLGFANGASLNTEYNSDSFGVNVSFGNMRESDTVLGMSMDSLLSLSGGDTQYVDAIATYKPIDSVKLSMRATFADTHADIKNGIISELSGIKSNSYALGLDVGNFSFTASMPLAVVSGSMGYDYADFAVVETQGKYSVEMLNPHIEYIDLATQHREKRFSGSYKKSLGEFTDAGFGFIYRVNPNNTDVFGNESILMLKMHHRIGI
jgi:hypothetical protein